MNWSRGWRLLVVLLLPFSAAAQADTWAPPTPKSYMSADQRSRLQVFPRRLDGSLAYFEDKIAGKTPAGQAKGETRRTAEAVLERRDPAGKWEIVWHKPLVNEVAPVNALIANDGSHVVTFDNWHSNGFGTDVVVVYGADGSLIRSLALPDLLPSSYIRTLHRSVSSIWWGGEHRLSEDGRKLILQIAVPSTDELPIANAHVELTVDLATGRSESPTGEGWAGALAKSQEIAARLDVEETAAKAAFLAPLYGPESKDEGAWDRYLVEAFFRLDPHWDDGYPAARVLRDPGESDYAGSVKWLREALFQKNDPGDAIAIASAGPADNLIRVLEEMAPKLRRAALRKVRLYIVLPPEYQARASAAFAASDATIIYLDPRQPISQRPERIRRFEAVPTD